MCFSINKLFLKKQKKENDSLCWQFPPLEFIIRAQQEGLLVVTGAGAAVGARDHVAAIAPGGTVLQRRLLCVLLVGWREVVDRILDNVMGIHGLLEAAGDALHGSTATCLEKTGRDK